VITVRSKQPSAMWRRTISALVVVLCAGLCASAQAATAAASEQDLRIGLLAEPTTLDPHFHNLTPNDSALSHVYERLIQVDDKSALIPGLAASWAATNDLTWVFKLRAGVTWHDGRAFTADDVVYTFERAASVPNSPSGFASAIKGKTIRKIDDLTVEISTPAADPLLLHQVARIMIVPRSNPSTMKTEDFNSTKAAIGTGPFRVAEYAAGKHLMLVRNDAYWGEKSKWQRIVLQPIPDGPQRVAALTAGEVDLIEDVPTADIARLKGEPTVEVVQAVTQRVIYLHLDQFRDTTSHIAARDGTAIPNPLLDKRVRIALSKAINRDAIVSRVMGGAAIPASQFLADGFSGTAAPLRPMAYDPDGAKKLLAEAGLPQGFKLTLHGTIGRYTNDVRVAEAIAQMFQRVGIETTLVSLPAAEFFARASSGDKGRPEFSVILAGRSTDTGEVSDSLNALVQTTNAATGAGAANRGRFSNTDVDTLIEAAQATMDPKARAELLAQASVLAIAEGAIVPVYHPVRTWAMRKGLTYKARSDEYTLATGVSGK
jgi:peptide/nickel transport system substrate-binding protein